MSDDLTAHLEALAQEAEQDDAARKGDPPKPVYLLFQWTDEREAKNHIGIFADITLAKQAAQAEADDQYRENGQPPKPLNWQPTGNGKGCVADPKIYAYGDEAFDIEEFFLDSLFDHKTGRWVRL